MTANERAVVNRRSYELTCGLLPFEPEQKAQAEVALSVCLGNFRTLRELPDFDVLVRGTLIAVRSFPLWVIKETCRRIVSDESDVNRHYAVNDAEIAHVCREVARPFRDTLRQADALLVAPVEEAEPDRSNRPTLADLQAKYGGPSWGLGPLPLHSIPVE